MPTSDWHWNCLTMEMDCIRYCLVAVVLPIFVLGCSTAQSMQSWTKNQGGIVVDARQARVEAVTRKLASRCWGKPITVQVLASDAPCAFSWRTGHVFVTRGLMDSLDDDELAAAVAHELGHLLSDGQLQTVASLRGCSSNQDREAKADAAGIGLLQVCGVPAQSMIRMLQKVKASPLVPPACRIALQRRIELLSVEVASLPR